MATNDTANILIRARNQTKSAFQEVSRDLSSLQGRFANFAGSLRGIFVGGAIGGIFSAAVAEAAEAERALNSLNAVLRATGNAAGLTRADIAGLANELDRTTIFDTDEATQAAAVLATFRSIAGDTFKDALRSAADLSALLGGDLQGSVVQLGKALEDPVRGISALSRVGVTFSQSQRDLIESFVEQNRLADAQRVILEALRGQLDGVAQEINQGVLGSVRSLDKSWKDLLETLGRSSTVRGSLDALVGGLEATVNAFDSIDAALKRKFDQSRARGDPTLFGDPRGTGASQAEVRRLDRAFEEEQRRADQGPKLEAERRATEAAAEARKKAAEEAKKTAETLAKQVDQTIEGYRREVQGIKELSAEQRVLADIEAGRYRGISGAQRERLVAAAREVDAARALRREEEAVAESAREWADALRDRERALNDQASAFQRLANPLDEVREKLAALDRIQADPLRALKPEVEEAVRLFLELQAIDLQFDGPVQDLIGSLIPLRAVNFELDKTLAQIRALRDAGEINVQTATELESAAIRRAVEGRKDPEIERIRDAIDPTRQLRAELERLQDLQLGGQITDAEYLARAEQLTKQIEDINAGLREQDSLADDLGFTFASAFEEAIIQGGNLRDILRGLEQDIVRMVTRQVVTKPLADLIGNLLGNVGELFGGSAGAAGGSGGGGFWGSIVKSFAGAWGARQHGGPVAAGQTVEAGEAGFELAVAGRMPRVLPHAIPEGKTVADVLGPDARPVLVGLNGPEPVRFDHPVRIIPHADTVALLGRMAQEAAQVEKVVGRPDGITAAAPALPAAAPLPIPAAPDDIIQSARRLVDLQTDLGGSGAIPLPAVPDLPDAIGRRLLDVRTDITGDMPSLPDMPALPDWAVERVLRVDTKLHQDEDALDRMLRGMFAGLSNGRELAEAVKHSVPHRRTGGLFAANSAMWVGEEGPELVAFGRAGRVIRNSDAMDMEGGRGSVYAPVTIVTQDLQSFRGAERQVTRDISRALSRAGR